MTLVKLIIILLLLSITYIKAQNSFSLGLWNLQSYNALIAVEGRYSQNETTLKSGCFEQHVAQTLIGEIKFHSKSFIWHPNFMIIETDLEYHPGAKQDNYLVMPNRTETSNERKFNARTVFFNSKPISIGFFISRSKNFINRELTTNVEMDQTSFGGNFSLRNPILPFSIDYTKDNWIQKELETGRKFSSDGSKLSTNATKSFSEFDEGRASYLYKEYQRDYFSNIQINNKISTLTFEEKISFDKKNNNRLDSRISNFRQSGTQNFIRSKVYENLRLTLPLNFKLIGKYQYHRLKQENIFLKQHNTMGQLKHQLYESIGTNIFYETNNIDHSDYKQSIREAGGSVQYQKKIPSGKIRLSYRYIKKKEKRIGHRFELHTLDEEHVLGESQIHLLNNPNVIESSIIVSNETQTIIFEKNIDFILIHRGEFIEIQRLPGGQIGPDDIVLIDYISEQQSVTRFDANNRTLGAGISLFNRLLDIYWRNQELDYDNITISDVDLLKTIQQRIYGFKIAMGVFSAGYESEEYNSNITPYKSQKFYLKLSGRKGNRFAYSLSANQRYFTLTDEKGDQEFMDISAMLNYSLGMYSKLNFTGNYRRQKGTGIDLDLTTLRSEFSTRYRQVYLSLGLEWYNRIFYGEKIRYSNGYIRLSRKI